MSYAELVVIDGSDLTNLLIACFTWSTLYFTLCILNPKRSYEWHIRTVTLIHAVLVSLLGAYGAIVIGPWPFTQSGGHSTPYQHYVITMSLGYFLLDLSWCLYFKTEGPVMLVHHTMSIVGLTVCFLLKYYGIEMITTLFGSEVTNPLLQCRWFLRETNNYDSILGDVVDVAFMTLFGLFRIVLGTCLLYSYFGQESTDWLGRLAGVLIYSMGWVFWVNIVQYSIKKYRKKYGKSKSKSKTTNNNIDVNGKENNGELKLNGSIEPKNGYVQTKENGAVSNGHVHKRHVNGAGRSTEIVTEEHVASRS
ncbi:TLC domain-containing protein 5-like [Ruditapes philippinarum]|uniref:TLC domain-containing protein 5-like n=1 Tax=Ruditapes philippinarum TaxID=129788 RepID=UPI00295B89EB|nr:TLC domain-containing protein 5-like [Ruditapes philippinarum]XP_060604192.1 TLC domain-containing protein 5-like [Ruditapes philippinarum]